MKVGCWYPGQRIVPYEDNLLQMSFPCCVEIEKETLKHYSMECTNFNKEHEEMSSKKEKRLKLSEERRH